MTTGDAVLSDQELAVAAAAAGAAVVRERFGGALVRFDKGGGDFATEADIKAEEAILRVLRDARPGDAVSGEESGLSGAASAERTWLVDPLCGTLNYATGNLAVAVNVALRLGSTVTTAAVADPFTDEVFWAAEGEARLRLPDGSDVPLRPSAVPPLVDVNLDAPYETGPGWPGARLISAPEFLERFRPRVLSTTLALTWVAAGRRAAYVTAGDLRDNVHFAAGIALCRAAGCVVTALDGGPVATTADDGIAPNGLLAAADPDTHRELLAILNN
ncbi:MAG: inositol monophosphatase family protein [Actinoplanes sp.]